MKITGTSTSARMSLTGQDQFRAGLRGHGHCFAASSRDAGAIVAEILDDRLDVQRDDRFVFDDHDLRLQAVCDRLARRFDFPGDIGNRAAEDVRGLSYAEILDCGEQQRLAGVHRQAGDRTTTQTCAGQSVPQAVKDPVEFLPRGQAVVELLRGGKQGLEHFAHGGIAQRLRSGQRARIAAQEGKLWPQFGCQ
jgi:hypothetical protein